MKKKVLKYTETADQNSTNNSQTLTDGEMETIKGQQLSVSAAAASTSGTSQILTSEKMQSIRGKLIWKPLALVVVGMAIIDVIDYAIATPRNQWTWQGAGRAALRGAVKGVAVFKLGKFIDKRFPSKPRMPPRPPRRPISRGTHRK